MSLKKNFKKLVETSSSASAPDWKEVAKQHKELAEYRKWSRNIALRVLQALDDKKMSQTDLAAKMGVSRQYVSNIMKGKINFTFETVFKLQNALDIKLIKVYEPDYEEEAVHEKYLTFNAGSIMSRVKKEVSDANEIESFVSSTDVLVNQLREILHKRNFLRLDASYPVDLENMSYRHNETLSIPDPKTILARSGVVSFKASNNQQAFTSKGQYSSISEEQLS